ncbi:hypothetical protein DYB38_008789 [Aphanomyces astaci]|uniref:Helicase ATP-binding domain-containing protein n=1 Tax=Aphanomyces astaci TaxID=112090 RepID=A0A397CYB0_APHAT|nr:hypothetical protein DYB38_008789 [Aphanomyces astaci]
MYDVVDVVEVPVKRGRGRPRKDPNAEVSVSAASKRKAKAAAAAVDLTQDSATTPTPSVKKRKAKAATVAVVDLTHDGAAPPTPPVKKRAAKGKQVKAAVVDLTSPAVPSYLTDLLDTGGIRSVATLHLGGSSAAPSVEIAEVVDVTDPPVVVPEDVLLGSFKHRIVGIQHYHGRVGKKEAVSLVRQPTNQYDRNAIAVFNLSGVMVGHIPRDLAAVSAPFLDSGVMTMEGMCPSAPGTYTMPIVLSVYGQEAHRSRVMDALKLYGLIPPKDDTYSAAIGKSRFSLDDKVDSLFAGEVDVMALPVMDTAQLPLTLRSTLLPHQLQALQWIQLKETPSFVQSNASVQLWQRHDHQAKPYYVHQATHTEQDTMPDLCRGGILADDMGLGKTLTMLTWILASQKPNCRKATLIVCPLSVVRNWQQQAMDHFEPNAFRVLVHHDKTRLSNNNAAHAYDIVLTTYGTLALEAQKEGPLRQTAWDRVILDEGHLIKNKNSHMFKAAVQLHATAGRWVLSGTPITNKIDDLAALMAFLRPLKRQEPTGIRNVKALMKDVALRRTKGGMT